MPSSGKLVAFASLWLGIVTGTVPVELLVPPETARVEVFLDGSPAGALAAPPWSLPVDLGDEIAPHELVAVAMDAEGAEIGRARQWLNLPRPAAVLEVTLAATPEAGGVARVAWAAPAGAAPLLVRASFDERALPVAEPSAVPLPPYDPEVPHLLRVEAVFPGEVSASRELVLGGALAEELSFELTGVPVLLSERRGGGEDIEVWAGDQALAPLAVEEGLADLVVVVDPGAQPELAAMAQEARRRTPSLAGGMRSVPGMVDGRFVAPLPEEVRLRVLSPAPSRHAHAGVRFELFAHGPELRARDGGLLYHLLRHVAPPEPGTDPRLADAVAVAALEAAQETRRRGVLLILGPGPREASHYPAMAVRRYLERLRVPLTVWTTGGRRRAEPPAAWGESERVGSLAALERAARRLADRLERQRIVWVAGAHLPQALTASPGLAGGGAPDALAARTDAAGEESGGDAAAGASGEGAAAPASGSAAHGATRPVGVPAAFAAAAAGPFALYTDLREPATVAAVERVARELPAVWSERFGLPLPEPLKGDVVVFTRDQDFRAFVRRSGEEPDRGVRGSARGGRVALAAAGQPPEEVTALLVHELSHLLADRAFGRELPPWLAEGLAEELALCRLTRSGRVLPGTLRGRVRARALDNNPNRPLLVGRYEVSADGAYGALGALLAAQRRGGAPALSELLALSPAEFRRFDGRRERYTASAFFVRFLLDGRERRARPAFHAFLAAVARGGPADGAALAAALGEPLALLERDFAAWLRLQATANR